MKRLPLNLLTVVSLLICVATCMMWLRSCTRLDLAFWLITNDRGIEVSSRTGSVAFSWYSGFPYSPQTRSRVDSFALSSTSDLLNNCDVQFSGFGWRSVNGRFQDGRILVERAIVIPHSFIVGSSLLTAIVAVWRSLHRRVAANACPHCGYDLRATPQRCPECGAEHQLH